MASKGNDRHMKSLEMPIYFGTGRKANKYVMKTRPGRHTMDKSLPIALFLKKENFVQTTSDAKKVLNSGRIKVNGKMIRDHKHPIGLSDIIGVGPSSYLVGINKNAKATFTKIENPDLVYSIVRKYKSRGGKIMFCLHDGSAVEGNSDGKVNDSVLLGTDRKIKKVIKLEKGARALVIAGVNVGAEGAIREVKDGTARTSKSVIVESQGGSFETIIRNVMVTEQ